MRIRSHLFYGVILTEEGSKGDVYYEDDEKVYCIDEYMHNAYILNGFGGDEACVHNLPTEVVEKWRAFWEEAKDIANLADFMEQDDFFTFAIVANGTELTQRGTAKVIDAHMKESEHIIREFNERMPPLLERYRILAGDPGWHIAATD